MQDIKRAIEEGRVALGIELGSTRIKAVLIGPDHKPAASGSYDWENRFENGLWTYHLDDVWSGLQDCFRKLAAKVTETYGVKLGAVEAIGISAMMHGYLAFDNQDRQLAQFRTWRNTTTEQAASELTKLFQFNIPQRWSVAHLYQAILNGEEHVKDVAFLTTLSGYVDWKLTGQKVIGIGDASGMFPIDSTVNDYDSTMVKQFDELIEGKGYPWKFRDIFPKVLTAGEAAGTLTEEGARLLDPSGALPAGRRDRHDRHEQRCGAPRQYLRRDIHLRDGRSGKAAVGGLYGDRYGDDPVRQACRDGSLQQLHLRYRRMGRIVPGICGGDGRPVHDAAGARRDVLSGA